VIKPAICILQRLDDARSVSPCVAMCQTMMRALSTFAAQSAQQHVCCVLQVCLEDAEAPQDVYSRIADVVRTLVARDAAAEPAGGARDADERAPKLSSGEAARRVRGEVDRKLVKQTVMTTVYGVTKLGARDQVLARCACSWSTGSPGGSLCRSCSACQNQAPAVRLLMPAVRLLMPALRVNDSLPVQAVREGLAARRRDGGGGGVRGEHDVRGARGRLRCRYQGPHVAAALRRHRQPRWRHSQARSR
jgi:DNA-dependent RNA polymerase